ncbi:poly(ADP-ribose) glycohydrolase isoform [Penicillium canescens]|uniref:poly(ADP-ribose) glycohydrolase isoform n=1 Tax=Penicillium canescens TaxID=5083 RepID=UPI0026DF127C|nr:poly(ADP-ribose) glycohydrolase isoform [Penicillium canescens]KAJ6077704.1 poly(ADP-ribose) glycohydrolase isoform [Penicillium canescens]
MSSEDAPWVLALDGVECRICGHSIKLHISTARTAGPRASRAMHGETRTMHAACWKIVERIWKSEFTMAELDGFLDVSSDLAPFLPEMPYKVSPIEIDAGLTSEISGQTSHQNSITISASEGFLTTLETEGLKKPMLPDMRHYALPSDLDRHVRRWLSDSEAEDVESLQNPTLGYWSSVARMLENHPQFSNVPPAEVAEDITQTLKHLYDGGLGCFPHLANYDSVHANAMTIVLTLLRLPLEDIQGGADLKGKRARLQLSRSIKLPPALDSPAKLKLQLSTLRRQIYVEEAPIGMQISQQILTT